MISANERRSANKAVISELVVFLLKTDAKLNIVSFYLYLNGSKNIVLSKLLNEDGDLKIV